MTVNGNKVKKVKVIKDGKVYQCKRVKLASGEVVFNSDFKVTVNCYEKITLDSTGMYDYNLRVVVEPFDSDKTIHVKVVSYRFYGEDIVQFNGDVTNSGKTVDWRSSWYIDGGFSDKANGVKTIEITHGSYKETVTVPYRNPFDIPQTSSWRNYYAKTFTITN